MKRILYATDFSKNADKAFPFALKIAEEQGAELVMLHVYDVPPVWEQNPMLNSAGIKKQARISWENQLKKFFEQFNSKLRPVFLGYEDASVVNGILSAVKNQEPDLLVIGTRGKSKIKDFFMGSTSKAMVKKSPAPVLMIPEKADLREYDRVIYASDLMEIDLEAIERLNEFVLPHKSKIRIVHVTNDDEYHGNEKMEWFKTLVNEKVSNENILYELLSAEDVFYKLNKYMVEHPHTDLLVMLEKERSGFVERMFNEDLVTKMEFKTSIPLLSYNERFLRFKIDEEIKKSDAVEK